MAENGDPASEISNEILSISPELETKLVEDSLFLFRMQNVIRVVGETLAAANLGFEISRLSLGADPENPTWRPIEVNVKVQTDDYWEILIIWDQISINLDSIRRTEDIHVILDN